MTNFEKNRSANTEPNSKRSYKMTNQQTVKTTKEREENTKTHSQADVLTKLDYDRY